MRLFHAFVAGLMILSSSAWGDSVLEPLLNSVVLQLNAEQWVTTKTALVTVGANASVNDQNLEKIQNEVLGKLAHISNKGAWHLVSFNRNLDQSGLEHIQISAEIRLASTDLGGLRDKAKSISKPGETFTIDNVEFKPSPMEIREVSTLLRNDIYQQINAELAILGKQYPEQKFYLHTITFTNEISPVSPPQPQPQPMMFAKVASTGRSENPFSIGDKMKISATVILAAAPNVEVLKMLH